MSIFIDINKNLKMKYFTTFHKNTTKIREFNIKILKSQSQKSHFKIKNETKNLKIN